jgi:ActR/RegA family two-component response regulator
MMDGSLLLVDDDRHVLESMTDWLRSQGFQVDAARGVAEAAERLGRKAYDLLLVDVRLQDGDGLDLLEQVRRNHPQSQVILITGYGDADAAVEALRAGALDYLTKPLIDDELMLAIERAFGQRQVIEENTQLKRELDKRSGLDNVVGNDPQMRRLFDVIDSVADTRANAAGERELSPGRSTAAAAGPASHSSKSPAAPCPRICSKASCSATWPGRLPARSATRSASSCRPTAARSFSTRSARPAPRCR